LTRRGFLKNGKRRIRLTKKRGSRQSGEGGAEKPKRNKKKSLRRNQDDGITGRPVLEKRQNFPEKKRHV